jgi:D-glycero-D-manno-heptose 1,7-bisphosphate phosphatase
LIAGVPEACSRLRELGYTLVVVTNQPDIARGTQTRAEVDRMHAFLRQRLPLDEIVVCPHDDVDGCECRKPKPGMILDAANRLNLDLRLSFGVGDRWRDVEAAQRAGVPAIYIERHYGERSAVGAQVVVGSLIEALPYIEANHLQGTRK